MSDIRILVADDHPLVREGLKRLIANEAGFALAGETDSGEAVLELCRTKAVDVVLLDITMPGPGFSEVLARLSDFEPRPAILVLSMHDEERYALRALRYGADGYLTKGRSPSVVAEAIRTVAAGGTYVSPAVATSMVSELKGERAGRLDSLSRREFQVLSKLGGGKTTAEVAEELSLSPKTVSTYRTRVLRKLRLRRTADLIRFAVEEGLAE